MYDLFVTWMKEWRGETDNIEDNRPRQTEFNKLNLNYTLLSKRNLLAMVNGGVRFARRAGEPIGFGHFAQARTVVMLGEDPQRHEGNLFNP